MRKVYISLVFDQTEWWKGKNPPHITLFYGNVQAEGLEERILAIAHTLSFVYSQIQGVDELIWFEPELRRFEEENVWYAAPMQDEVTWCRMLHLYIRGILGGTASTSYPDYVPHLTMWEGADGPDCLHIEGFDIHVDEVAIDANPDAPDVQKSLMTPGVEFPGGFTGSTSAPFDLWEIGASPSYAAPLVPYSPVAPKNIESNRQAMRAVLPPKMDRYADARGQRWRAVMLELIRRSRPIDVSRYKRQAVETIQNVE